MVSPVDPDLSTAVHPCARPPVHEVPDQAGDVTVIKAEGVAAVPPPGDASEDFLAAANWVPTFEFSAFTFKV